MYADTLIVPGLNCFSGRGDWVTTTPTEAINFSLKLNSGPLSSLLSWVGIEMAQRDILVLFDVDGTLTPSRLVIKPEMKEFLLKLKQKVVIGNVTS